MMNINSNIRNEEGGKTEKFAAKTFKKYGYWSYIMPKKVNGQPCDIVATKGGKRSIIWLVDAKHVEEEKVSFTFDRIEPNQLSSFDYATNFAKIRNCGFAIFFERTKKLYWFAYADYIKYAQLGCKSVNMNELIEFEEALQNEDNY